MRLPHQAAGVSGPWRDAAADTDRADHDEALLAGYLAGTANTADADAARRLVTLLLDDTSTEIALNGPGEIVKKIGGHRYVEGHIRFSDVAAYHGFVNDVLLAHTATAERIDGTHMILEGQIRLPTGDPRAPYAVSRLHVLAPPLPGLACAKVTIAKKAREPLSLGDMVDRTSLTDDMAAFLATAAAGRAVIVVSGVTGSGKCLAPDTTIQLGDGTTAELGPLADQNLANPGGRVDVVAFRAADTTALIRPVRTFHRRPAPPRLHRLELDTGETLTLTPEHPVFIVGAHGPDLVPAGAVRPGAVLLAPAAPPATRSDPARGAVVAALGRSLHQRDVEAGAAELPGVRLPTQMTADLAWTVGVLVGAGATVDPDRGSLVVDLAHVLADELRQAHRAVFGVAPRPRARGVEIDHPLVVAFLRKLGVASDHVPPWSGTPGWNAIDLLAGVADACAAVQVAERRVRFAAGGSRRFTLRLLHQLGHRATAEGPLLVCQGAAAVALVSDLPLRGPCADAARRLQKRGAGRDEPIVAVPGLLDRLLDELVTAGAAPNRTSAAALIRDTLGMRERSFFHALAGQRPLTWPQITRLPDTAPDHRSPLLDQLHRLRLHGSVPLVVRANEVVDNTDGHIPNVYDLSVDDPDCRAFLAGGVAVHNSTLLEALSHHWDLDDRVIVIEDTPELAVHANDVVYLESYTPRPGEDPGRAVPLELLVRQTMRMRMDRVVVGECRGGEVLDWLIAANSGAQGSATTVHADTPRRAIDKLMRLASRSRDAAGVSETTLAKEIAATVDLVVQLGLVDGRHVVLTVEEVSNTVGANSTVQTATLFAYDFTNGRHDAVNRPSDEFLGKLAARGAKVDLAPWQRPRPM